MQKFQIICRGLYSGFPPPPQGGKWKQKFGNREEKSKEKKKKEGKKKGKETGYFPS